MYALDLNRTATRQKTANEAINSLVDEAMADEPRELRAYLGASALGSTCLRQIQWDWRSPVAFESRTLRIFARGHWVESYTVACLRQAGFKIAQNCDAIAFQQMGGMFRGHGDGLVIAGPEIEGVGYPCLWEHKGLGSKGWAKVSKEGLARAAPGYADQVALYQAYFNLTEHPAIFTACNMDTMELLHLLVPFDASRAQAASDRAVAVINADRAGETLPRGGASPEAFICKWCKHKDRCWA